MSESGDWKQYAYKNDTEEKRIVGKMKILLVDDERTEREGIRFLIEKFQLCAQRRAINQAGENPV